MCGIAGLCNWGRDWQRNIGKMNEAMAYRGPDASGIWACDGHAVVLGHRRLSVVDLTPSGAQPMESHNSRYVIAFNGEIYNHREIKDRLTGEHGTVFRGTSDTEILLEAVSEYGIDETLRMIKGMFAFAVYDKQERLLMLARDRVGEKPLYYGFTKGSRFVFASDLNSVMALDGFDNPVNRSVLHQYFRYGYIPAPYSVFENIYKLRPGTYLTIRPPYEQYDIRTYWSMQEAAVSGQKNLFQGSRQEAAEELERLLKDAIRGQMEADVPVGAFLSAGIDSSTVVALMQSLSGRKVKSFTIGMWDEKFNEAPAAKEIAAHLGTEHTELYITEEDARNVIPLLAGMFGEPFADSSQIPTYLVSRMTKEHVTVSLSGDGGDELFCGYGTYSSVKRIWDQVRKIPRSLRRPAGALIGAVNGNRKGPLAVKAGLMGAGSIEDMYLRSQIGEGFDIVRDLPDCPTVMDTYPSGLLKDPVHNLMLMDLLMYHPDDILNKVDRTAMAVSLETRVPMLDRDVVEFAWTLPMSYRYQDGGTKMILRDILYRYVPHELMERPKQGFAVPLHSWLKEGGLREWAEDLLARDTLDAQGLLDTDTVRRLWSDYIGRGIWRAQIWYILMFQEWLRHRERSRAHRSA